VSSDAASVHGHRAQIRVQPQSVNASHSEATNGIRS
jgi:hypothetical protein